MRDWLEKSRESGISLGLERTTEALEAIGRPDRLMRCIHVAGSNGKGSACAYIAASLITSGEKVGMFTSPHVSRIEERIRIDGVPVASELFDAALAVVKATNVQLTFFEITYLAALYVCSQSGCDFMILETGLGGRLDATRTADVIGCLLTSISLEHTDILGDTIEEIAREKAAIAREGIPIISRDTSESVRQAILEVAPATKFIEVHGDVSQEAKILARELLKELRLPWYESEPRWPARMQIVNDNPKILLDAAHNPSGMVKVIPDIENMLPKHWTLVFGSSPQNDLEAFLNPLMELIERNPPSRVILTEPQGGRYPGLSELPIEGEWIRNPNAAINSAIADEVEMILVIGSLYLCGNVLSYLCLDTDEELSLLSQPS